MQVADVKEAAPDMTEETAQGEAILLVDTTQEVVFLKVEDDIPDEGAEGLLQAAGLYSDECFQRDPLLPY